jgi:GNAT superfamily N-acetyltransferase
MIPKQPTAASSSRSYRTRTPFVGVAEHSGRTIGYVFAGLESTNWMELRGPCGLVHDLYVDESGRHLGAGRQLLQAAIEWIRAKGRSQVALLTKTKNEPAQHLFAACGFRPTMIEMTLDLGNGEHDRNE